MNARAAHDKNNNSERGSLNFAKKHVFERANSVQYLIFRYAAIFLNFFHEK